MTMPMPQARGPLSAALLDALGTLDTASEDRTADLPALAERRIEEGTDVLRDNDLQLSLYCLYELYYGGLPGVPADAEWHPELIRLRRVLETAFETALRAAVTLPDLPEPTAAAVSELLFALAAEDDGPSVSRFIGQKATLDQLREFLMLRSIYQLREADPHSWAIPRLPVGRAKAALVEIQADEYGGGRADQMHSHLFAVTMEGLGLDSTYGGYLDRAPALVLAANNAMSLFGLNRRLRGAVAGHLAAFEMTSSIPNSFYARGFRRHGFDGAVVHYFDEHVEADAVHEQIAARDLAGGLVEAEPELLPDVVFGACTVLALDALAGGEQLQAWKQGRSALYRPDRSSDPADGTPGAAAAALDAAALAEGVPA